MNCAVFTAQQLLHLAGIRINCISTDTASTYRKLMLIEVLTGAIRVKPQAIAARPKPQPRKIKRPAEEESSAPSPKKGKKKDNAV